MTSQRSAALLRHVYAKLLDGGTPALVMDLETAELVKVSANAFLATKISFINAMAEICEKAGADVVCLADALARDGRIGGRFLSPGLGFGGGCLPKDIRAFRSTARELGAESVANLLGEVDAINLGRRSRVTELARDVVGGCLAGRRLAVLGLAFKPESDDVRDSPSLHVCGQLLREGALVSVHDPVAMGNAALSSRPSLRQLGVRGGGGRRRRAAPDRMDRLPRDRPGHARGRGGPAEHDRRAERAGRSRLAMAGWAFRTLGRGEDPGASHGPGCRGTTKKKVRDDELSHTRR